MQIYHRHAGSANLRCWLYVKLLIIESHTTTAPQVGLGADVAKVPPADAADWPGDCCLQMWRSWKRPLVR